MRVWHIYLPAFVHSCFCFRLVDFAFTVLSRVGHPVCDDLYTPWSPPSALQFCGCLSVLWVYTLGIQEVSFTQQLPDRLLEVIFSQHKLKSDHKAFSHLPRGEESITSKRALPPGRSQTHSKNLSSNCNVDAMISLLVLWLLINWSKRVLNVRLSKSNLTDLLASAFPNHCEKVLF